MGFVAFRFRELRQEKTWNRKSEDDCFDELQNIYLFARWQKHGRSRRGQAQRGFERVVTKLSLASTDFRDSMVQVPFDGGRVLDRARTHVDYRRLSSI